jgi:hypothetical protein
LLNLACKWDGESRIYGNLERILIWILNKRNAQIIFQQKINYRDNIRIYVDIYYDECDDPFTYSIKRFIYKYCQYINIYGEYFQNKKNIKKLSDCSDHFFLKIILDALPRSDEDSLDLTAERNL